MYKFKLSLQFIFYSDKSTPENIHQQNMWSRPNELLGEAEGAAPVFTTTPKRTICYHLHIENFGKRGLKHNTRRNKPPAVRKAVWYKNHTWDYTVDQVPHPAQLPLQWYKNIQLYSSRNKKYKETVPWHFQETTGHLTGKDTWPATTTTLTLSSSGLDLCMKWADWVQRSSSSAVSITDGITQTTAFRMFYYNNNKNVLVMCKCSRTTWNIFFSTIIF